MQLLRFFRLILFALMLSKPLIRVLKFVLWFYVHVVFSVLVLLSFRLISSSLPLLIYLNAKLRRA